MYGPVEMIEESMKPDNIPSLSDIANERRAWIGNSAGRRKFKDEQSKKNGERLYQRLIAASALVLKSGPDYVRDVNDFQSYIRTNAIKGVVWNQDWLNKGSFTALLHKRVNKAA